MALPLPEVVVAVAVPCTEVATDSAAFPDVDVDVAVAVPPQVLLASDRAPTPVAVAVANPSTTFTAPPAFPMAIATDGAEYAV